MSVEQVTEALEGAKPVEEPSKTEKKKAPPRGKGVLKIVDDLKKAHEFITDAAGNVYKYHPENGAWEQITEQVQLAIVFNADVKSSPTKRRAVLETLKASTVVPKLKWGRVALSEIPCANGIVDVLTGEVRPHKHENMLERVLPVKWAPDAKNELWEKALGVWFPEEKDLGRRAALQEFFGYICLAHAKYKQALVLYGESDTGKSVPAMLAKRLVGEDYYCSLGVEDMDDPVRRALIKGKALNILTELSAEAMIADGGFKTLVSTEEPVSINAKYLAPETYVSTAKHVIVTNNLPRFNDHTSAMFNRLLIIPFTEVLPKADQDREILEEICKDLSGVLAWAAAGARRLVQRHGQWPEVEAARSIMVQFREDMNPIRQFMAERMIKKTDAATPLRDIAYQFNQWNTGGKNYGIRYVGKLLRAAGHAEGIREVHYKGRTLTCLKGFRLLDNLTVRLKVGEETETLSEGGVPISEGIEDSAQLGEPGHLRDHDEEDSS